MFCRPKAIIEKFKKDFQEDTYEDKDKHCFLSIGYRTRLNEERQNFKEYCAKENKKKKGVYTRKRKPKNKWDQEYCSNISTFLNSGNFVPTKEDKIMLEFYDKLPDYAKYKASKKIDDIELEVEAIGSNDLDELEPTPEGETPSAPAYPAPSAPAYPTPVAAENTTSTDGVLPLIGR